MAICYESFKETDFARNLFSYLNYGERIGWHHHTYHIYHTYQTYNVYNIYNINNSYNTYNIAKIDNTYNTYNVSQTFALNHTRASLRRVGAGLCYNLFNVCAKVQ